MNKFEEFLRRHLSHNQDALVWTVNYIIYCHAIDDVIDGDKTDSDFILKTFRHAPIVFTHPFYLSNYPRLYPLVLMAHDDYRDSVEMEKTNEKWKRQVSDIIRSNANAVLLAVIELVNNVDIRNSAAMELRELSFKTHHTEAGIPC